MVKVFPIQLNSDVDYVMRLAGAARALVGVLLCAVLRAGVKNVLQPSQCDTTYIWEGYERVTVTESDTSRGYGLVRYVDGPTEQHAGGSGFWRRAAAGGVACGWLVRDPSLTPPAALLPSQPGHLPTQSSTMSSLCMVTWDPSNRCAAWLLRQGESPCAAGRRRRRSPSPPQLPSSCSGGRPTFGRRPRRSTRTFWYVGLSGARVWDVGGLL